MKVAMAGKVFANKLVIIPAQPTEQVTPFVHQVIVATMQRNQTQREQLVTAGEEPVNKPVIIPARPTELATLFAHQVTVATMQPGHQTQTLVAVQQPVLLAKIAPAPEMVFLPWALKFRLELVCQMSRLPRCWPIC